MQSQDTIRNLIDQCIKSFKCLSSEAIVSEELARFKVWIGNAGNYRRWEDSLRDASHIRDQIISLLEDLDGCLHSGQICPPLSAGLLLTIWTVADINNGRTVPGISSQ